MDRETSSRVSSIASEVLRTKPLDLNGTSNAQPLFNKLLDHAKILAGSCLSQDQTPGQEPLNFLARLKREREDLADKVSRLGNFIDRGSPGVEDDHRELLHIQHSAMTSYLKILDLRLAIFGTFANGPRAASDPPFDEPVEVGGHDEDRDGPVPFSN